MRLLVLGLGQVDAGPGWSPSGTGRWRLLGCAAHVVEQRLHVLSGGAVVQDAAAQRWSSTATCRTFPRPIPNRAAALCVEWWAPVEADRKSTRLNSSHVRISYAVFCLKKKK